MTETKDEQTSLSVKGKVTHINVKSGGMAGSAQLLFVVNSTALVVGSGYPPQVFSAMASVLSAAFNSGHEVTVSYDTVPGQTSRATEIDML